MGDGLKVGKAGRKMPGVKRLHQQSESNTKPEYILGHSCQAVGILAKGLLSVVAIPLAARIHEGVVGAFFYHFWMAAMTPITRKARDQYLHRKTRQYRDAVRRKLAAYHRFIQLGLIAQGIMLALATTGPQLIWASFGSWLRTIRPGIVPSEAVAGIALRNTLPHFLADSSPASTLAIFIRERLDPKNIRATRLDA